MKSEWNDTREREGGEECWMLMKAIKRKAVRETELWREMIMKQLADRAVNPPRSWSCCVWSLQPVTHSASHHVLAASESACYHTYCMPKSELGNSLICVLNFQSWIRLPQLFPTVTCKFERYPLNLIQTAETSH